MKTTKWREYSIKACLNPEPDSTLGSGAYHHDITVELGSKKVVFSYWGSWVNPEVNTHIDACYAFQWFVDKAISGMGTYNDFLKLTKGVDNEVNRNLFNFSKDCRSSLKQLVANDEDIYSLGVALHRSERFGYEEKGEIK